MWPSRRMNRGRDHRCTKSTSMQAPCPGAPRSQPQKRGSTGGATRVTSPRRVAFDAIHAESSWTLGQKRNWYDLCESRSEELRPMERVLALFRHSEQALEAAGRLERLGFEPARVAPVCTYRWLSPRIRSAAP